ncbi:MAG: hypothetical protein F6K24_22140 [Okeania sp. SIO2D1]|nr:hypothetical protein [Okeania sp. SIO2D1]
MSMPPQAATMRPTATVVLKVLYSPGFLQGILPQTELPELHQLNPMS